MYICRSLRAFKPPDQLKRSERVTPLEESLNPICLKVHARLSNCLLVPHELSSLKAQHIKELVIIYLSDALSGQIGGNSRNRQPDQTRNRAKRRTW